jgi:CDP-diacylglycerol pyrophosphatase
MVVRLRRRWAIRSALVAAVAFAAMAAAIGPALGMPQGSRALWRVVHDLCVTDMRVSGHPAPCLKVDLRAGYAVLADPEHPMQLLLVPTRRLSGIEDPRLLAPGTPNYWALAWANRKLLDQRAGRALPRQAIGLAVNSVYGRSQDQLHIHIDCVRADVAKALASGRAQLTRRWRPFHPALAGHRYAARWIPERELATRDPFRLLARRPAARGAMDRQTLALVGEVSRGGRPGFVLLDDAAVPGTRDQGHAEELLDHACRIG